MTKIIIFKKKLIYIGGYYLKLLYKKENNMKMSDKELYQYSKSLDMLGVLYKKLKNLHIYRYSKFIDSSDSGVNCRFARASKEALPEEEEEFMELLLTFKQISDLYREKYKEEIFDDQEDKPKKRKRSCCR